VRQDVAARLPEVPPGGVPGGHDDGSKHHLGVANAVDELLAGHLHPVELDANKVWWTLRSRRPRVAAARPAGRAHRA
jgi:hypothetical protein